jgi:hypothetical protein
MSTVPIEAAVRGESRRVVTAALDRILWEAD